MQLHRLVHNCTDLYTIVHNSTDLQTVAHNRPQADTEKHKRGAKSYILFFAGVCTMYMYLYMNLYLYLYLNMNMYMYLYMYMIMYLYMSALRAALFWKNQQSAFFQKKFNFCAWLFYGLGLYFNHTHRLLNHEKVATGKWTATFWSVE